MSYTMTVTFTKPANKQWWYESDPAAGQRLYDFCAAFPGVVSVNASIMNETTNQSVTVFADQAAQQALAAACAQNADWIARRNYMNANGITVAVTFA